MWEKHVVHYSTFIKDIESGNLPAVSWFVGTGWMSDHPPGSVCVGENATVQQINAIMKNSELWKSTAIIVVWDDYGGFYDHVAPPKGPNEQIMYGFRVPALIISPYAKKSFIDKTFYSFPSMHKFVETIFDLPSLNAVDAQANDLIGAFDFSQKPLPPLILKERDCEKVNYTPINEYKMTRPTH